MAHSIKNPQIKHAIELISDINMSLHNYYLCNHACSTTMDKIVYKKKDVTCKNCLKIIGKKEICAQCGYLVDDWVVIEDPDQRDWVMQVWRNMGMNKGDIVCSECYFK